MLGSFRNLRQPLFEFENEVAQIFKTTNIKKLNNVILEGSSRIL